MFIIIVIILFALACATGDSADISFWFFPIFVGAVGGIIAFMYEDKHSRRRRRRR